MAKALLVVFGHINSVVSLKVILQYYTIIQYNTVPVHRRASLHVVILKDIKKGGRDGAEAG